MELLLGVHSARHVTPHTYLCMQADLDLGNYERFLDVTLSKDHNITTGKVYSKVLAAERRGDYLGKTVQVIPHVTDEIQDWIERVSVRDVDGATCTFPPFIHTCHMTYLASYTLYTCRCKQR
jgi:hypothetical protein